MDNGQGQAPGHRVGSPGGQGMPSGTVSVRGLRSRGRRWITRTGQNAGGEGLPSKLTDGLADLHVRQLVGAELLGQFGPVGGVPKPLRARAKLLEEAFCDHRVARLPFGAAGWG